MSSEPTQLNQNTRPYPTVSMEEDGSLHVNCASEQEVAALLGMQTFDAAVGVYKTALNALGKQAEEHCNLASAMFSETEPRDAFEAMLVAQMTATHVAMTTLIERMTFQREVDYQRCQRRADKIRARLGWQSDFDSGWVQKPKGMHWRTYERLVAELEDFEHASNVSFYNYFGQCFGGLIDE